MYSGVKVDEDITRMKKYNTKMRDTFKTATASATKRKGFGQGAVDFARNLLRRVRGK